MKEFTIGPNDAGQRLDRFLAKAVPLLPASLAQKYIRLKRIKRNGARAQRDDRLLEGDVLQLYINDEFFDVPTADNAYLTVAVPRLTVVYEDENLLLVDKQPGIPVHPHDGAEPGRTLIDHILAYLYQKREWRPREEASFTPALCNRIDRNTGGLVIAAKNAAALRDMNAIIKAHAVQKSYLCLTVCPPKPAAGRLESYLLKNEAENRVRVFHKPVPGAKYAATVYRTLEILPNGMALVRCDLETGRTHQIRAQLASIGAPLAGDTKYGRGAGVEGGQALYAYRLDFSPLKDGGTLQYLKGRVFYAPAPELAGTVYRPPETP